MTDQGIVRRRKLPHVDMDGKPYFITGTLAGSISAAGLRRIDEFRKSLDTRTKPEGYSDAKWNATKHKLVFRLVDELLDGACPVSHFKDDRLSKVVANSFLHFADHRYLLFAFVVMPSHHHWLFLPKESWVVQQAKRHAESAKKKTPREIISQSTQSFTATMCNRLLGCTGTFWQPETYDHYARDEDEFLRIPNYIEENPVKAGLVKRAQDWRWSSAKLRAELGIEMGAAIPKMVLT